MTRIAVNPAGSNRGRTASRSAAVVLAAALVVGGGLASASAAAAVAAPSAAVPSVAAPSAAISAGSASAELAPPTIAGTPRVGLTLTATISSWGPGEQPYATTSSWSVGGTPVTRSVNSKTLLLTAADLGKTVTFSVVGLFPDEVKKERTSAPTAAISAGVSLVKPGRTSVTGSGLVGVPLTATTSGWMPDPVTFAYRWSVGGKPVAGAVASTYAPVAADAGKRVTVAVTGSYAGAASATRVATLDGSVVQVGSITGTVSLPGTPARPVTNGDITLYRSYALTGDNPPPLAFTTTVDGKYTFSGVTPGDYTLKFTDRDTGQEAFLGGGISASASTPLTVASGKQITKNFIFPATAAISGVLKLDGPAADPFDAFVITATSAKGSTYGIADADGIFTIPGLPAGSYTLSVTTYNNRDQQSIYGTQVYTVGLGSTPGHVSVIAGRETTGVTITVKPAPLVTGLVTIADTGQPSPFTLIEIYKVVGGQPDRSVGDTQTETDGTFRLPPLEPGLYKLMAHPPAGEGLGDAYFGGTSLNTATVFNLRNGDVLSGLTVEVPTEAP